MTRRVKTDALLKDIGRLLVNYGPADWAPILTELRDGTALQRKLAGIVEELAATQATAKPRVRKPGHAVVKPAKKRAHPERAGVLEELEAGLRSRTLLRDTKALREVLSSTGAKGTPTLARAAAITELVDRLDRMPEERFAVLAQAIRQPSTIDATFDGDYARWFSLILDRPTGTASLSRIHAAILSSMDKAMVRGAAKFPADEEPKLKAELERWTAAGGAPAGARIVDRFLKLVGVARHAEPNDLGHLDDEVYRLKREWYSQAPAASQATTPTDADKLDDR